MNASESRTSMDHSVIITAVLEEIERYKRCLPILLKDLDRNELERNSQQSASHNCASAH
jgi:hypothetical protein